MTVIIDQKQIVYCEFNSNEFPLPCKLYSNWDEACEDCPLWGILERKKGGTVVPPSDLE